MTLQDLKQLEPEQSQMTFTVFARLQRVQFTKRDCPVDLVYEACGHASLGGGLCLRKVREGEASCQKCLRVVTEKVGRLQLRAQWADMSGACWLTTFHDAAERALGFQAAHALSFTKESLRTVIERAYCTAVWKLNVRTTKDSERGTLDVAVVNARAINFADRARTLLNEVEAHPRFRRTPHASC